MTQDSVSNHVMYLVIVYRYFLLIWNNPSIICFFFFFGGWEDFNDLDIFAVLFWPVMYNWSQFGYIYGMLMIKFRLCISAGTWQGDVFFFMPQIRRDTELMCPNTGCINWILSEGGICQVSPLKNYYFSFCNKYWVYINILFLIEHSPIGFSKH